jgi:hypothetical protein
VRDGEMAPYLSKLARLEVLSGPQGTIVSATHATFAKMPQAAWKAADVMQPLIPGLA